MKKMMRAEEQERREIEAKIDTWWQHHFHNVREGSALYASLCLARDDLKRTLGVARPVPDETPPNRKETSS